MIKSTDNVCQVGGTRPWELDPTKAAGFTTAQFYGCTVLIIVNGHNVIIGHYAEVAGDCWTMTDQNAVEKNIIAKFNAEALFGDYTPDTRAWIIESQRSTQTIGYKLILKNLESQPIEADNIKDVPYFGSSGVGEFPGPQGKAIVTWTPRTDGSGGATLNVYIQSDNPTFTQDYDCHGNPTPASKHKRGNPACVPKPVNSTGSLQTTSRAVVTPISTTVQPTDTPTCTYVGPEPPITPEAYCSCRTSSLPLTKVSGTPVPEESSCAYQSLPTSAAMITDAATATTNLPLCQVCTPNAANEDHCTSIPSCQPQTPRASVTAGSSSVHVGTLTSTSLYTSMSSALEKLCPSVTQTQSPTVCETGSVSIGGIPIVDQGGITKGDLDYGDLVVTVELSSYNVTSLRDAMIKGAALAIQNSATGNKCYKASYSAAQPPKRDLGSLMSDLAPQDAGEHATWCNSAGFAASEYYSEYATTNATDLIYVHLELKIQGGDYACDFLPELTDALALVAPEFAVEDVELGEAIEAVCENDS